jgi:hypothetical protein
MTYNIVTVKEENSVVMLYVDQEHVSMNAVNVVEQVSIIQHLVIVTEEH